MFWLTVHAPPDAAPGTYRSRVTVQLEDQVTETFDLVVIVRPFTLPERPDLRVNAGRVGWYHMTKNIANLEAVGYQPTAGSAQQLEEEFWRLTTAYGISPRRSSIEHWRRYQDHGRGMTGFHVGDDRGGGKEEAWLKQAGLLHLSYTYAPFDEHTDAEVPDVVVWAKEFPIRFDFLDTMDGGNLSFQVHPLTEFIQQHFGMHYTQDESYYLLDAGEDGCVYLGLREGIDPRKMLRDLETAQAGGPPFDAEKYANRFPARPHDHFLIPAGTVHCSGRNAMVLEISATPYIFTFKLWDWGRVGLDGLPRPINLERGGKSIQWDRTTGWVQRELINRVERLAEGDGWCEERTGLHAREFIETRRHWFTGAVTHDTHGVAAGSVNVLNLVEGREAIVESPEGAFEPFVVHYAETFVVPAVVGRYTIRPHGESEGRRCGTIKAYVRCGFGAG